MRLVIFLSYALIALGLTSCATLSKDECLNMNWTAIGIEDGASGFPAQRIGLHREACAKYGVSPNLQAYNLGRSDGLKEYCRPANAYDLGLRGKSYAGVCPGEMAEGFADAYEDGHHLFQLKDTVQKTNAALAAREKSVARLEHDLSDVESDLVNGDNTPEERQFLVDITHEISDEIAHLYHQIRDLQVRLGREEYELALYSNTHVQRY